MTITPIIPNIPFSEKEFDVRLNGLELSLIKFLISQCATGETGEIAFSMWEELRKFTNLDVDTFPKFMENSRIPLECIPLHQFIEAANKNEKPVAYKIN